MAMEPQSMPNRIKEFRKQQGLTLKDLADKLKTTPQTVQRLEAGTMTVSLRWLEAFAGALKVSVRDLINDDTQLTDPHQAFFLAARNGMIHNRRIANADDVIFVLSDAFGHLGRQVLEHKHGLRPASDVYEAATVLAGAAMRIALDCEEQKEAQKPTLASAA